MVVVCRREAFLVCWPIPLPFLSAQPDCQALRGSWVRRDSEDHRAYRESQEPRDLQDSWALRDGPDPREMQGRKVSLVPLDTLDL